MEHPQPPSHPDRGTALPRRPPRRHPRRGRLRQELLLGAVLVPVAVWLGDSGVERALMIATLLQVLIVELLNSAIETVVDRFGPEHHDLSRRAKDIGSAAVFISLLTVPTVWALALFT